MNRQTLALTDRRCDICHAPMQLKDRSAGGAITLYECPSGHLLFVGAQGQEFK